MRKVVVSFVGAAALATAGMAAAANSTGAYNNQSTNNPAGIFVSGNLGYGYANYLSNDFRGLSVNRGGFAWNANAGYQFNQYVALEAGYTQYGTATVKTTPNVNIHLAGFNAAVKGIYPINDQFNLFGKLGMADMHESASASVGGTSINKNLGSAWTPELGAGAAYNLTNTVALTLQDVYTFRTHFTKLGSSNPIPATNDILAGVSYKFNV